MLENVERALKVFLRMMPPQNVLNVGGEGVPSYSSLAVFDPEHIPQLAFIDYMRRYDNRYSDTELRHLYKYLDETFEDYYYRFDPSIKDEGLNLFRLMRYYVNWVLLQEGDQIVCHYWRMLHWRMMTYAVDETLLATCFAASQDYDVEERHRFDWNAVITHNNHELHYITDSGIAENHSHLKGAAPLFPLSWVSMMNNLDRQNLLGEIENERRMETISFDVRHNPVPLTVMALQASYIRLLFFLDIMTEDDPAYLVKLKKMLIHEPAVRDVKLLDYCRGEISEMIRELQFYNDITIPDYAMMGAYSHGVKETRMAAYEGERWLLYSVFRRIYRGTYAGTSAVDCVKFDKIRMFYAYILIKEQIRGELVQVNETVGFENFMYYEHRKDIFLDDRFFQKEQVKNAVMFSMFESNTVTYEARLAPKDTIEKLHDMIKKTDQRIELEKKETLAKEDDCKKQQIDHKCRYFYVLHFIKTPEDADMEPGHCRDYNLRMKVRQQAKVIAKYREEPQYREYASRIKGIDAANLEIRCGPEVFAQAYRFLSNHRVEIIDSDIKMPHLMRTYHVGEDFLDMVSGIRAIDETIRFLQFNCGDRLGHALAVGISPEYWYNVKNYRIVLRQQEYLDNIAWMYHFILKERIGISSSFENFLRGEFDHYFGIIYRRNMAEKDMVIFAQRAEEHYRKKNRQMNYVYHDYDFSIDKYYDAWKLRSDNPEAYRNGYYEDDFEQKFLHGSYETYSINSDLPHRQIIRYMQEYALLYYYYHYDKYVKKEGERVIEVKIKQEYVDCVRKLQDAMLRRIAKKGISIETNPSSNFKISCIDRYANHPIVRMYNRDLVTDPGQLAACSQINVSINTDDAGIFCTSLENEYALLALALEKVRDENGEQVYKRKNIYRWLDEIRKMGLEQTFLSDAEMKQAEMAWKLSRDKRQ